MQVTFGGFRLFVQHLHDMVAAEVGSHQNHRVTEVDFPPLAVAHKTAVKDLIEQVHHVPVRLFHFVQQHHAVWTLAYRFGEDAALAVADVARRRSLELGDGVRLLVFGEIDGDKRFLAAEQFIGKR